MIQTTTTGLEKPTFDNKYATKEYYHEVLLPEVVKDVLDADCDYQDDYLWEIVDGHEAVIYTYQAKGYCEAFDLDPFGESELTGEPNRSWSQMFFEKLYTDALNEL